MLAELAEIGMELAREVRRQMLDRTPDPAVGPRADPGANLGADLGLVFSRIARAVRQTVALEARLASEAEARAQQGAAVQASQDAAQRVRTKQQKARIKRLVEDAISAGGRDTESLLLDLDERLEDPDVEADFAAHPIGVVFAAICEDLGITADLRGFTDAELGFDIASPDRGGKSDGEGGGVTVDVALDPGDGGDLLSPLPLALPPWPPD